MHHMKLRTLGPTASRRVDADWELMRAAPVVLQFSYVLAYDLVVTGFLVMPATSLHKFRVSKCVERFSMIDFSAGPTDVAEQP